MELTVKILRAWFTAFNAQYFGSRLPEPRLLVSSSRTLMGQYSCRRMRRGLLGGYELSGHTIRVSDFYDLTERDYQQTLLHEMIHYYISYTHARDTSAHGPLFRQLADRINAAGGWHITVSERRRQLPVRQENVRPQYLLLLLKTTDGLCFQCVINPRYRQVVDRQAARSPQVAEHHWLVSTEACYASWPQSRSLRGRRMTAAAYEALLSAK